MRYGIVLLLVLVQAAFAERVPGRYMVELSGESVAEHVTRQRSRGGLRSASATARRAVIRAEQAQVRNRLGANVAVLDSIDTVGNALLVSMDEGEAARVATAPGVRRVVQVRLLHRLLDRAVVVNRIVEAWDQVGDDKAGAGIKIAIIDTGVDSAHPALLDASLTRPATYPRTNNASDEEFTSNKVIVARSYVNLLVRRDTDTSARDRVGHGTALAVAAAGVRTAGPLATIQGVAPRAFIGSYKVFGTPGVNDGATDAAILKAIDDAVADGMDILNLSLGDDVASRLEDDVLAAAVERAAQAGVLVVCAAGNNGPDFGTISSPATARSAIAVGATRNDRTFGSSVSVEGLGAVLALRSSGVAPEAPVSGALADVSALDQNGLACEAFPSGSLAGKVALIQRGTCLFESKLNNAQRAGAAAAIVYATAADPEPFTMGVGAATLPAQMVSYPSGVQLKENASGASVALRFSVGPVPQTFDRITSFSAIGPSVDLAIKPEIVAVGGSFYVATQSFDPNGDMYSANGFALVNGTSFSAPLVAGALALLKSARPGLTTEQYRSLLIQSATPVADLDGEPAPIQKTGGGQMHLAASLRTMTSTVPAMLNLGAGGAASAPLRLENLSGGAEYYSITIQPHSAYAAPVLSATTLEVAAGQSGSVSLALDGSGLPPGAYDGFVRIQGATTGTDIRVPYWFAVKGTEPAAIPLISKTASGRRTAQLRNAIFFRVTDAAGIPISGTQPEITPVTGDGSVVSINSYDAESPGLFGATLRLGPSPGVHTFRIKAGEKLLDVSITAQ